MKLYLYLSNFVRKDGHINDDCPYPEDLIIGPLDRIAGDAKGHHKGMTNLMIGNYYAEVHIDDRGITIDFDDGPRTWKRWYIGSWSEFRAYKPALSVRELWLNTNKAVDDKKKMIPVQYGSVVNYQFKNKDNTQPKTFWQKITGFFGAK